MSRSEMGVLSLANDERIKVNRKVIMGRPGCEPGPRDSSNSDQKSLTLIGVFLGIILRIVLVWCSWTLGRSSWTLGIDLGDCWSLGINLRGGGCCWSSWRRGCVWPLRRYSRCCCMFSRGSLVRVGRRSFLFVDLCPSNCRVRHIHLRGVQRLSHFRD